MATALIIGATRGLGNALVQQYAHAGYTVYGTSRKAPPSDANPKVKWVEGVDIGTEGAGDVVVKQIPSGEKIDVLIVSAGFFGKESFDEPDWKAELTMYTTSSIGPVFLVQKLVKGGLLSKGSKVVFVSSESGSIALRYDYQFAMLSTVSYHNGLTDRSDMKKREAETTPIMPAKPLSIWSTSYSVST
jgi:short-subunit dehydrogenase